MTEDGTPEESIVVSETEKTNTSDESQTSKTIESETPTPSKPTNTETSNTKDVNPSTPTTSSSSSSNNNNNNTPSQPSTKTPLIDQANEELATLLEKNQINISDVPTLQQILRDNITLREKITKLKSLLARSAKAQRDSKSELDSCRSKLEDCRRENQRLASRVERLENRPTHMDLLADFEANFDRAVLSIGEKGNGGAAAGGGQSGGEDPNSSELRRVAALAVPTSESLDVGAGGDGVVAAASGGVGGGAAAAAAAPGEEGIVSSMLLTELSTTKSRLERLETLNNTLLHRASHLEQQTATLTAERDTARSQLSNLQLEYRMAKMEADNASRAVKEKSASLNEMQMEIDLVTKSAMDANVRAEEGMRAAREGVRGGAKVDELEARVEALQEWALASAEAKALSQERCRLLEAKVKELSSGLSVASAVAGEGHVTAGAAKPASPSKPIASDVACVSSGDVDERRLWNKTGSLVVGAGMAGCRIIELGTDVKLEHGESVLLRWKFDITPTDMDILFSILKGHCGDHGKISPSAVARSDALIRDRHVKGGGGGEVSAAFAVQNACTLVFSNTKSWVRPRAVKFTVEAYAVL